MVFTSFGALSWVGWRMFPFLVETPWSTWRLPEPDDERLPLLFSLKASKS